MNDQQVVVISNKAGSGYDVKRSEINEVGIPF